ncbi:hypothetical protein FQR65_LT03900 [Abscondita terminalis]|nr:hypothetical protein FQR65_LT03900 [Abscondita terminalis]
MEKGSWSPSGVYSIKPEEKNQRVILHRNLSEVDDDDGNKPAWLKQWTISKGWMHNRSHLLELGVNTEKMDKEDSSVSEEDIQDLLSISSDNIDNWDKIEVLNQTVQVKTEADYSPAFDNYRTTFPDTCCWTTTNQLPELYKERLQLNAKSGGCIKELLSEITVKTRNKKQHPKKDASSITPSKKIEDQPTKSHKSALSQDISTYNALNSKTNLHEDVIYECSESSASLYNNPIYVSTETIDKRDKKFFDFHSNHQNGSSGFIANKSESLNKKSCKNGTVNGLLKSEKYVIRHIKIRIMLSLRVNKFKRFYKRNLKKGGSKIRGRVSDYRSQIKSAHAEQRRIGSGKGSLKIQNMRFHNLTNLLVPKTSLKEIKKKVGIFKDSNHYNDTSRLQFNY